jgi:glycosyltransferase involved in cell wall biosynthesis
MLGPEQNRIGYVVKRYPRYSETFIVNEILAHEAAGWEVEIFSLRPPVDTHFQNAISRVRAPVTYLNVPSMKASALWSSLQENASRFPGFWSALNTARGEDVTDVMQGMLLAQLVRQRGLRHLHAHFATSPATIARLAAKFAGITYTFTAHAKDIYHESVCPLDLERKLRDTFAAVTVSRFNINHLREQFPALTNRVHCVYNGMPLQDYCYSSPTQRPPQIVAVGRLVPKKGFDLLLDACTLLRQKGVNFQCSIVGSGDEEAALRERINRLGLMETVELHGARPQTDVKRIVQESAVLAAPCVIGEDGNRDGMPTVLLEAMALGTPCVATDVTGIPELVKHEQTGLLVPQNDSAKLATALQQVLESRELAVRLAENARRLIEEQFDVQCNAQQLRDLFQRAISSRDCEVVEWDSTVPHVSPVPNPDLQEVR